MADKVLVVDDELRMRDLLSDFLPREGYNVLLASDGDEAIELAKKVDPQVILLDISMPKINGLEVCKRLKTEEKTRFIPIIMMTGFAYEKMEAVEAGADDFLSKPFDLIDLSFWLKSVLRIRYLTHEIERLAAYIEELELFRDS